MNIATMIPHDKALHALGGACLAALSFSLLIRLGAPAPQLCARILVAAVGLLKEIYDKLNSERHTPDLKDAIATWLGGEIVLLPEWIVPLLV